MSETNKLINKVSSMIKYDFVVEDRFVSLSQQVYEKDVN